MYEKNLTEDLRLRLTSKDMDFLRSLSADRGTSVSEVIRSIIGEYRRSLETLNILKRAMEMDKEGRQRLSNGDTETNIDD